MAGLLWSSLQFVSCRTVIVEGTMSDERRRSHSHLHHMPGLTFNDRSKLSVTLLKCEPRQNHISLKHETLILVIYSFNFWVGHPCSQLLLCLLLCLSVLSLGQIFELEPCGPYKWNSSIHCVYCETSTAWASGEKWIWNEGDSGKIQVDVKVFADRWWHEIIFMHFFLRIM